MKSGRLVRLMPGLVLIGGLALACGAIGVAVWLALARANGDETGKNAALVNHIALVGNDGNVWLAAPDKDTVLPITTDGRGYRFPTWSPDSRRLAFIGPDDDGNAALYAYNGSGKPTILFDQPESAPFYIYWSPDSRAVTFLTQESTGLVMRLADVEDPGAGRVMGEGAPFYWSWSPEGNQVFLHVGGARALSEEAHLFLLENQEGAAPVELKLAPGWFQTPLWSSDGRSIFYIATDDGGAEAIYKTDVGTSVQTLVTSLSRPALMALAPNDSNIAYLQFQDAEQNPASGTVYVVGTDGQNRREVLSDWAIAMYWSPDGRKLALLTAAQDDEGPTARVRGLAARQVADLRMRWWVFDIETEALEPLVSFIPTLDFVQTVPFFDQYHLSLTFWSPDSRYLVVSRRNADSEDGGIWIVDSTAQEAPRQVGDGTFAVWSWD